MRSWGGNYKINHHILDFILMYILVSLFEKISSLFAEVVTSRCRCRTVTVKQLRWSIGMKLEFVAFGRPSGDHHLKPLPALESNRTSQNWSPNLRIWELDHDQPWSQWPGESVPAPLFPLSLKRFPQIVWVVRTPLPNQVERVLCCYSKPWRYLDVVLLQKSIYILIMPLSFHEQ